MIDSLYEDFKHWSAKGSVYIISDLHFGDSDCKLMDRDWLSPDEHVTLINSIVKKNDTLIVLGDVGDVTYISKLKAGYKVLIMGNHDSGKSNYQRRTVTTKIDNLTMERLTKKELCQLIKNRYENYSTYTKEYSTFKNCRINIEYLPFKGNYAIVDNNLFDEVYDGALFISSKILLSHEPIYGLNFCMNIHGHDHNLENKGDTHHINLASNVCRYTPLNLGKFIKDGCLSDIKDIHRITIDNAMEHPLDKINN